MNSDYYFLNGFPPIFCITLDAQSERSQRVATACAKYGLELHFLLRKKGDNSNILPNVALRGLSKPVIGCLCSHLYALDVIWRKNLHCAIICEDDIDFDSSFQAWDFTWTDLLRTLPSDAEYLKLHQLLWSAGILTIGKESYYPDGFPRIRPLAGLSGACYVVTKKFCEKMVARFVDNPDKCRTSIWDLPLYYTIAIDLLHPFVAKTKTLGKDVGMYYVPITIVKEDHPSTVGGSSLTLRLREVWNGYMLDVLKDPSKYQSRFRSTVEYAKKIKAEFIL